MDRVIVGMSGGVDSAVAALILKESGYDVIGVTLRVWHADDGSEGRCCDIDDARSAAMKLGIPYYPVNCTLDFQKYVTDPFADAYIRGLTPNPCILCNRSVKWEKLLFYAKVTGAKYVATGHYASVVKTENGRFTLKKALYYEKDQTYMLYRLTQEQLAATIMPLGEFSKTEVRRIAAEAGLPVASRPDSEDVCFAPKGGYADYVARLAPAGAVREGNIVDAAGNVLGKHKGIIRYTVGQRKGLGVSLGYPAYVTEIRPETNEITVGDEGSLYSREILCTDVNYMSIPGAVGEIRCAVKVRYNHPEQLATVRVDGEGISVIFDEPVRAAAPGQSAVFYDRSGRVIGGGIIAKSVK